MNYSLRTESPGSAYCTDTAPIWSGLQPGACCLNTVEENSPAGGSVLPPICVKISACVSMCTCAHIYRTCLILQTSLTLSFKITYQRHYHIFCQCPKVSNLLFRGFQKKQLKGCQEDPLSSGNVHEPIKGRAMDNAAVLLTPIYLTTGESSQVPCKGRKAGQRGHHPAFKRQFTLVKQDQRKKSQLIEGCDYCSIWIIVVFS